MMQKPFPEEEQIPAVEITFEPRIPVVGQILVLDALDTLYSLFALGELEWRDDFAAGDTWVRFVASSPGKLLRPEHLMIAHSARTGSVIQVLAGYGKTILKLFKFLITYKQQVEKHELKQARDKLQLITKELLPLLEKLKRRGVDRQQIETLLQRAYLMTDEVLASLMVSGKLGLSPVRDLPGLAKSCPTCKGAGRVP